MPSSSVFTLSSFCVFLCVLCASVVSCFSACCLFSLPPPGPFAHAFLHRHLLPFYLPTERLRLYGPSALPMIY